MSYGVRVPSYFPPRLFSSETISSTRRHPVFVVPITLFFFPPLLRRQRLSRPRQPRLQSSSHCASRGRSSYLFTPPFAPLSRATTPTSMRNSPRYAYGAPPPQAVPRGSDMHPAARGMPGPASRGGSAAAAVSPGDVDAGARPPPHVRGVGGAVPLYRGLTSQGGSLSRSQGGGGSAGRACPRCAFVTQPHQRHPSPKRVSSRANRRSTSPRAVCSSPPPPPSGVRRSCTLRALSWFYLRLTAVGG